MAQVSIDEGLAQEPRDYALKNFQAINVSLNDLRNLYNNGDIDIESFVERLDRSVHALRTGNLYDSDAWRRKVATRFPDFEMLSQEGIDCLATGEYLIENIPSGLDYSPAAIEFCKALEIELERCLFSPFKSVHVPRPSGEMPRSDLNGALWDYCGRGKQITLGSMAFILQVSGSQTKIAVDPFLKSFADYLMAQPNWGSLLSGGGVRDIVIPVNVNRYRNGAAHCSLFPLERAEGAATWAYSALNRLLESPTRASAVQ